MKSLLTKEKPRFATIAKVFVLRPVLNFPKLAHWTKPNWKYSKHGGRRTPQREILFCNSSNPNQV
jgi:hypothetical protein